MYKNQPVTPPPIAWGRRKPKFRYHSHDHPPNPRLLNDNNPLKRRNPIPRSPPIPPFASVSTSQASHQSTRLALHPETVLHPWAHTVLLPLRVRVSARVVVAEDLDLLRRIVARVVDVGILAAAQVVARPHALGGGGGVVGRAAVREVGGEEGVDGGDAGADDDDVELVARGRGKVSGVAVGEVGGRTHAVQMKRGSVFPVLC